jgi:membrane protease YdiL (CAAX protease family)
MIELKCKDMQNFNEFKWLKIAFPVAVFSIFCSLTLPKIIFLAILYFDININSFFRILLGTIPVQLSLLLPILITIFILRKKTEIAGIKNKLKIFRWNKKYLLEALKIELIIFLPLCILTYAIHSLLIRLGYNPSSPITVLLSTADLKGIILIFVISVFLAPIAEEIIFRRIFFSFSVKLMSRNSAIIITSFLFAALHGGLVQIVPLALLGCILQTLYIKYDSIYPCLILHALHNFIMMSLFTIAWSTLK